MTGIWLRSSYSRYKWFYSIKNIKYDRLMNEARVHSGSKHLWYNEHGQREPPPEQTLDMTVYILEVSFFPI